MEVKKIVMCCVLGSMVSAPAVGAVKMSLDDGTKFEFGGYVKTDFRYVDGEIAYQDYWTGNKPAGTMEGADISALNFNARESRFYFQVARNGWTGRLEFDLYGGGGNQVVSNSANPRLRHAFIKNSNWLIGQQWTTFMHTFALQEALNFGGPQVSHAFIRQPQIRYMNGGFALALEVPETWGDAENGTSNPGVGITGSQQDPDESVPDIVVKYTHKADWGAVAVAGLLRTVDPGDGSAADDTAFAANFAGKFNVGEKNDVKFEINVGESGRYVGVGFSKDIATQDALGTSLAKNEILETTAFKISYRNFWSDSLRSTFYYGQAETDDTRVNGVLVVGGGMERSHWGMNLIKQITPQLWVGGEIGQYAIADQNDTGAADDFDSDYFQVSTKYAF